MADIYASNSTGLDSPGVEHYDITPHNSNDEAVFQRVSAHLFHQQIRIVGLARALQRHRGAQDGGRCLDCGQPTLVL